jgi:hypothetical protein
VYWLSDAKTRAFPDPSIVKQCQQDLGADHNSLNIFAILREKEASERLARNLG